MTEEQARMGTLSFVEWAHRDFSLEGELPAVGSEDDLRKILAVAQLVRDVLSVNRNWGKEYFHLTFSKVVTEEESLALIESLSRTWLKQSYELKDQASREWCVKFDEIFRLIGCHYLLSDAWFEAARHRFFMHRSHPSQAEAFAKRWEEGLRELNVVQIRKDPRWSNIQRLQRELGLEESDWSRGMNEHFSIYGKQLEEHERAEG